MKDFKDRGKLGKVPAEGVTQSQEGQQWPGGASQSRCRLANVEVWSLGWGWC